MRPSSLIALAVVTVPVVYAAPTADATFDTSLDVLRSMIHADDGVLHIADDGVARSYNGQGEVIDALRMSKAALLNWADHYTNKTEKSELKEIWDKADSTSVQDHDVFHPAASLLPRSIPDPEGPESASNGVSANPQANILSVRSTRYCYGRQCTTSAACAFMGCIACIQKNGWSKECI